MPPIIIAIELNSMKNHRNQSPTEMSSIKYSLRPLKMRQPLSGSFARSISTTTTRSPAAARSSTITASPVETLRSSARVEQRPSLRSASTARISEDRYSTKAAPAIQPTVHNIFENTTGSWQYVVADPETLTAVIIDPVLEFEPVTQTVGTRTADKLLELVKKHGYKVERILETHAHADHMTAASYLQRRLASDQGHKPSICIGSRIDQVQKRFSSRYHVPKDEYATVFDTLLEDEEEFSIGNIKAKAIHIPGHTPDHMGYKIGGKWCYLDACLIKLLTKTKTTCLPVTSYSTRTWAPLEQTSPAAVPSRSSSPRKRF